MKGHGPADPRHTPRFAGTSTFLRLPHMPHIAEADVAIVGLPLDSAGGLRSGARFAPKALREASLTLRPFYSPAQRVAVFERISAIDFGDAATAPGFIDRSFDRIEDALAQLHAAGVVPIGFGGDQSVLLPELRAAARRHGPLALILFSSHTATQDEDLGERYTQNTVVRRALEERLIDPARSTLLGMRGGLSHARDHEDDRERGFQLVPWDDLVQMGTGVVSAAVDRAAGKAFLSFAIDFVDPAFAPGTGRPECGGPSSMQALALLRACRGLELAGADIVEVVPELDSSHLTTMLGATLAWEVLTLLAASRPKGPDEDLPFSGR